MRVFLPPSLPAHTFNSSIKLVDCHDLQQLSHFKLVPKFTGSDRSTAARYFPHLRSTPSRLLNKLVQRAQREAAALKTEIENTTARVHF